jgi:hypothetical protein
VRKFRGRSRVNDGVKLAQSVDRGEGMINVHY